MLKRMLCITGGLGYIGGHCLLYWLDTFAPLPVLLVDYAPALKAAWLTHLPAHYQQRITLVSGDITDETWLAEVFAQYQPTAVLHLAALSVVADSFAQAKAYHHTNTAGTVSVAKALVSLGARVTTSGGVAPRAMVFASSAAVYGAIPWGELGDPNLHSPLPASPYGLSKWQAEQALQSLVASQADSLQVAILRYFNVLGNDPQGRHTENHSPETHLWPLLLSHNAKQQGAFIVNPAPCTTVDGSCVRDYQQVTQVAQRTVSVAQQLLAGEVAHPMSIANVCSGQPTSTLQLLAQAQAARGETIPWAWGQPRRGDVAWLVGDPSPVLQPYHPLPLGEGAALAAGEGHKSQKAMGDPHPSHSQRERV